MTSRVDTLDREGSSSVLQSALITKWKHENKCRHGCCCDALSALRIEHNPHPGTDWCSCERLVLCFDCNVAHDHTILRDLQFSLSSSWTFFSFNRDMQKPSPPPVSSWLGYRYWTDFIRAVMAADILKCSTGRVLMLKDCLIFGRYLCHRAKYTSRSVVLTTCVRSRIKNNSRPRMTDRSVYIMTSSSQMETILVIYNLKSFKWFIFVCWTTIMNLYDLYKSVN